MNDLFFLCGFGLFLSGLWVIYPPATMIVGGLSIMYLAVSWGTYVPRATK